MLSIFLKKNDFYAFLSEPFLTHYCPIFLFNNPENLRNPIDFLKFQRGVCVKG